MPDETPAMSLDPAPPVGGLPDDEDVEETQPVETPTKPGYQTTEFWLSVVVTIAGLVAAAGLGELAEKITALIITVAPTIVYTLTRKAVKQSADDVTITKIENGHTHD